MEENIQKKSGFVTLIGRPNMGKFTLVNYLIGWKIVITSDKPQTTRDGVQTVYTNDRGQIIFLDTSGIYKAKNKLGECIVNTTGHTLKEVDVTLWLVEPATFIDVGECHITKQIKGVKAPVILVISRINMVKSQDEILIFIAAYKDVRDFVETVPLSTLEDESTDLLIKLIFKYLPYDPQFYDEDAVTDQPMQQIASELVCEKALRLLDDEVPHGVTVTIERMKERGGGLIDIEANIICERRSRKGIIIGRGGSILKRIGTEARKRIENMVDMQVNLQLQVRVRRK